MKTSYNLTHDGNDISYIDINVQNTSPNRVPASFIINRTAPFLSHPNSEYFASIIRFTVPLSSQPLFLFYQNTYYVSITLNGNTASAPLIFQQTDFNKDQAFQFQVGNLVGAIYNYDTLASMVNIAIQTCCTTLGITGQIPYMYHDCIEHLYTVYAPLGWADIYPYTNNTIPKLFFNNLLQTLFVNFNAISYDNAVNNNNKDYLVIIQNNNNNVYTDSSSVKWLTNQQEWNSPQYTNSLSNISIVSNALPYTGDSLNNIAINENVAQSGSIKSISDFELDKSIPGAQRSQAQYTSQNNRYLDLTGNNKLTSLDMSFFCFYEELVNSPISPYQPLILNPYDTLTLKLMFKRKELNY